MAIPRKKPFAQRRCNLFFTLRKPRLMTVRFIVSKAKLRLVVSSAAQAGPIRSQSYGATPYASFAVWPSSILTVRCAEVAGE